MLLGGHLIRHPTPAKGSPPQALDCARKGLTLRKANCIPMIPIFSEPLGNPRSPTWSLTAVKS